MPVIRGKTKRQPPERRQAILQAIRDELRGLPAEGRPVIFEVPVGNSELFDVIVVWPGWEGVATEERAELVEAAYVELGRQPSLAMGVVPAEVSRLDVLPYAVETRPTDALAGRPEYEHALLELGGFRTPDGGLQLRFPTSAMAGDALHELQRRWPGVNWVVVAEGTGVA